MLNSRLEIVQWILMFSLCRILKYCCTVFYHVPEKLRHAHSSEKILTKVLRLLFKRG